MERQQHNGSSSSSVSASVAVQTVQQQQQSVEALNPAMDHMFKELEASVKESLKGIDEINKELKRDREKRERDAETAFVPEQLKGDGVVAGKAAMEEIQQSLLSKLASLPSTAGPAGAAFSLSAWLSTGIVGLGGLEHGANETAAFASRVRSNVRAWLAELTGLGGGGGGATRRKPRGRFFLHHGDAWEGARLACRVALDRAYQPGAGGSSNDIQQHQLMMQRPPVAYLHPACPPAVAEALALQLCLPRASVRRLLDDDNEGTVAAVTPEALSTAADTDAAANGRKPLFAASVCGSDPLSDLVGVCRQRGIWLHAHGPQLADALLMTRSPEAADGGSNNDDDDEAAAAVAYPDSIGLDFALLLGLPGLPLATWISDDVNRPRSGEEDDEDKEEEESAVHQLTLWLPVWLSLQRLGRAAAFRRAARVRECRAEFARLVQSHRPRLHLVAGDPTDVLFRYADDSDDSDENADVWLNAETTWLVESLSHCSNKDSSVGDREVDAFRLAAVPMLEGAASSSSISSGQRRRIVGRYRPLECPGLPTEAEFDRLRRSLDEGLRLLGATRKLRPEFERRVSEEPKLELVRLAAWPGLGAVRYVSEATDRCGVNRALLEALRLEDAGFSWGEASSEEEEGEGCIRFGLVPEDTDLAGLLGSLVRLGGACDSVASQDEALVTMLRRSIDSVEADFHASERARLEREGVLRQVPFVDSLVNWLSPLPPEPRQPGTALSLHSGQLSSTELTYRYKVQFAPGD